MFENSRVALVYGSAGTGKSTLINHIAHLFADKKKLFLAHTNPAVDNLKRRVTASKGVISEDTKIEPDFVCSEKHRAFFKEKISDKSFSFNVAFQKWLKSNTGETLEQAIACWKYKKSLQGHNRYEKTDLVAIS